MLVLSRKLDESIKIGNDIKITILRVKGNTIRIGIDAPSDVRVIRSELRSHDLESSENESSTVTAIVEARYTGRMGGAAIARVLSCADNP